MRIDIWSDIVCPWCYIGLTRFGRVLSSYEHADGVDVHLRAFQLDPHLPEAFDGTEVEYLAESKGMSLDGVRQMFDHVQAAASTEGLRLDFDQVKVANSRRAHRLLHAARTADQTGQPAWEIALSLFKAHFVDGLSISDPDTLVRLATEAGLDGRLASEAMDSAELDLEVSADIQQAAAYGITGVPFFVLENKYGISGAQPAEVLTSALEQVWAEVHG